MKSRIRMVLPLLTCLLVSIHTSARADDLPSVDEVMHKFVEATGGEKAWKSVTSYRTDGTLEMPSVGLSATVVMMGDESGDSRMEVEIPGAGTQAQGVSGDVAWELSVMSGPRVMKGNEAASFKRQADMLWFLDWKAYYTSGTCVGVEEVDGESCYRLELMTAEASQELHFFSVETGLERQISMTVQSQMGEIPAVAILEEYGNYDGLRFPTHVRQSAAGMEQIITLSTFEKNPKFAEDAFALPEEVRALLQPAGK